MSAQLGEGTKIICGIVSDVAHWRDYNSANHEVYGSSAFQDYKSLKSVSLGMNHIVDAIEDFSQISHRILPCFISVLNR